MGVLDAFQSAFPGLYAPTPEAVADGDGGAVKTTPGGAAAAQAEQYSTRIQSITSKFEATRTSTEELEQYLREAQQEAKQAEARALARADEEFTPAWRNVGLPQQSSHLELDQGKMVGGKLVNPIAIIRQYKQIKTKEVLQPPRIFEYNDTSIEPHYLRTTHNLQMRTAALAPDTMERAKLASLAACDWLNLSETEVKAKFAEAEARRAALAVKMPADQYDLEKKIIKGMHHKLAFLRNPRYPLPPGVKMLQSQFQEGHRWNVPENSSKPAPPIKANLTSNPEAIFVVEPLDIIFTDWEVGGIYTKRIHLRNVTGVLRSLRLLPPASQYFHISLPRFPGEEGVVAPGMAAEVKLRFCPDSLADYTDSFSVDTASSRFSVPLLARRAPPSLTLPQDIHLGEVLVGNQSLTQIPFTNEGGPGRFRIIPEAHWPLDFASAPQESATVGPFRLWPLFLDMATGEEACLGVTFSPEAMGSHEERFIIVCDNCQVKSFVVRGLASDVEVELGQVDGRAPSPGELDKPLLFGEVVPGSSFSRRISVRNTTSLPFPFQWTTSSFPQTRAARTPNAAFDGSAALSASFVDSESWAEHNSSLPESANSGSGGTNSLGKLGTTVHRTTSGSAGGAATMAREVDRVALGLETESLFRIEPAAGVLQPEEVLEFVVTFLPQACTRYERWAQLKVDRTVPGRPPAGCDVTVQEIGFEGIGTFLELNVSPPRLLVPGVMTPGQKESRMLTLENRSSAPAHFNIRGANNPSVAVHPSSGTVPPLGRAQVTVSIHALEQVGTLEHELTVEVQHGPSTPIQVRATVGHPRVEIVTTRINFGLVRLLDVGEQPLVIRNTSQTCFTPWSVRELTAAMLAAGSGAVAPPTFPPAAVVDIQDVQDAAGCRVHGLEAGRKRAVSPSAGGTRQRQPSRGNSPGPVTKGSRSSSPAGYREAALAAASGGQPGPGAGDKVSSALKQRASCGAVPADSEEAAATAGGGARGPHMAVGSRSAGEKLGADSSGRERGITGSGNVSRKGGMRSGLASRENRSATAGLLGLLGATPDGSHASLATEMLVSQEPASSHLTFEPECGVLGPGQELTILVRVHALSDGQHCSVVQVSSPGSTMDVLEAFACIVTPHCVLSTPSIDLGCTYVGVIVKHTLQLRNLSLLPVEFKWTVDSTDDEPLSDMRIKPDRGMLGPGEDVELQLRYAPRAVGQSTLFGVCEVSGAPEPTGFVLSSNIKGLDVVYDLFTPEQYDKYVAMLAQYKASGRKRRDDYEQYAGRSHLTPDIVARIASHQHASTTDRHLEANFGLAVPLGETRQMQLVVHNRTAMHTSVRSWLDCFGLEDANRFVRKAKSTVAVSEKDVGAGGFRDTKGAAITPADTRIRISRFTPIKLSGDLEKGAPFRAAEGNDMMATRRMQEESEHALGSKGLAVSVTPPESTLEPWGSLVMTVSCFNDMCGNYMDMLHVKVGDLPAKHIPIRVGVAGTPLVVQKERVLIKGLRERSWKTALQFGQVPKGLPVEKPFYVFNTGSLDMLLSWKFRRFQDNDDCSRPDAQLLDVKLLPTARSSSSSGSSSNPPLTYARTLSSRRTPAAAEVSAALADPAGSAGVGLEAEQAPVSAASAAPAPVQEPLLVRLALSTHAAVDTAPFVVSPQQMVIKGGESAKFSVAFTSGRTLGHEGYLVGTQQVFSPEGDIKLHLWPTGDKGENVGAMFSGTFHPFAGQPPAPLQPLHVDLAADAVGSRLEPDAETELSWACHSTLPEGHRSYSRTVTLSNLQTCPLLFDLAVLGQGFSLISATPSVPQDPVLYQGTTGLSGAAASSGLGGRTYLPPGEAVDVTLHFKPPQPAHPAREDLHLSGGLRISYSNGDEQVLPLEADITHPAVAVSPATLSFGPVHVHAPKPLDVTLSNPTIVDACWAVTLESVKPKFLKPGEPGADGRGADGKLTEARFGPWLVKPACGVLQGRGLKMDRKQKVTVTYAPVDMAAVGQKLVFAVLKGRSASLEVDGSGSFDERTEHLGKMFQI